jgi:uncharacterized protein YbjT (DUF2867 family)
MKTALLLGASGLVGGQCLRILLDHPAYDHVIAVVRRPLPVSHPKLVQKVIDFERLEENAAAFQGDDLFYCMGTTLKKAGSRDAFRRVDHDYPIQIARIASRNRVAQWLMISAVGASPRSPFFYFRTKGEVDREISGMPFRRVRVFRPSFLLGERADRRPLEALFIPVFRAMASLLVGPLRRFRPIEAPELARQMVESATS